ncbi:unnamed protein product [Schistocephalus solidus]|uniref:Uncharacterized protein n=1 Tax=Schistocephalus solidus TaxID=70667 RepID=A0A183T748_SCHSO|nr:unnamed protein product [Schistocephalus solidus]
MDRLGQLSDAWEREVKVKSTLWNPSSRHFDAFITTINLMHFNSSRRITHEPEDLQCTEQPRPRSRSYVRFVEQSTYLPIIVKTAIMPDLAGIDDVTDCASPCVKIRGSRPEQLTKFSSPTTSLNTEGQRTRFDEPGFELSPSSKPPIG